MKRAVLKWLRRKLLRVRIEVCCVNELGEPDPNGELDEIVIWVNGFYLFHLERMDTNAWWMAAFDQNDRAVHVNFSARGKIRATVDG